MLVAVSKYAGIDDVRELVNLGHRDFGENLVPSLVQRAAMIEEWQARQKALPRTKASSPVGGAANGSITPSTPVRWHMIGHLQRNKVKKAVELSRLIHSVDSLRLAEEIQLAANKFAKTAEVLVQVNTSGEASKFGCAPAAASHLVEAIETMINVRVRGLMVMAPHWDGPTPDLEGARETFGRCRELFVEMRRQGLGGEHFNILSMGMSEDYPVAIAEGANLVRVGSAIFGPPPAGADRMEEAAIEPEEDDGEE
jgi:pyridoxal phosphate enzyme (YggS family)